MNWQLALTILVALLGVVSFMKEYTREEDLNTPWRIKLLPFVRSFAIVRKRLFKRLTIILYIVVFVLQIAILFIQQKAENDKNAEQLAVKDTMLAKFETSIRKANNVLKQTDKIYKTLNHADTIINKQLLTQDSISKNAKRLLEENKVITLQQSNIYNNIDRVFNPLFPMNIELSFELSLNNLRIKQMERKIKQIQREYQAGKTAMPGVVFWSKPGQQTLHDIDIKPDSVFLGEEYREYLGLLDHEISVLYSPYSSVDCTDLLSPQTNFIISKGKRFFTTLQVNFENNKVYIDLVCEEMEFTNSPLQQSTAVLGFNDLSRSYISIDRMKCDNDFKINRILISTHAGLQKELLFSTTKNDYIVSKLGCKTFFHKIKEKDFTYKQKPIVPKYVD